MDDPIKPAGELPPDLHKLTINIEQGTPESGYQSADKLVLYGTRDSLVKLQALMETLIEALNEAAEEAKERDTLED